MEIPLKHPSVLSLFSRCRHFAQLLQLENGLVTVEVLLLARDHAVTDDVYSGNDTSTKVRLMTSSGEIGYARGRVQVRYNDTWKAICDNHWGMLDAQVICRMLCFQYVRPVNNV